MGAGAQEEPVRDPSEGANEQPRSPGPAWDAAIAFGLDMSLLVENLALSPAERLARLQQVVRFHAHLREAKPLR